MINQLAAKIQKTHAPIVVGLAPMMSYIPAHIQEKAFQELGETLEGAAEAIWQFNKEIIDHTYDLIPAVKPLMLSAPFSFTSYRLRLSTAFLLSLYNASYNTQYHTDRWSSSRHAQEFPHILYP